MHLKPLLAYIPDLKHVDKEIIETREIIEKENAQEIGHSCLPYTLEFWKNFEKEKILIKQRIKNRMDGFGYYTDEERKKFSISKGFDSQEENSDHFDEVPRNSDSVEIERDKKMNLSTVLGLFLIVLGVGISILDYLSWLPVPNGFGIIPFFIFIIILGITGFIFLTGLIIVMIKSFQWVLKN